MPLNIRKAGVAAKVTTFTKQKAAPYKLHLCVHKLMLVFAEICMFCLLNSLINCFGTIYVTQMYYTGQDKEDNSAVSNI